MIGLILYFAVIILVLVGFYKALEKAGQPGWSIFIPIYSAIVLWKVAGRDDWWAILIPIYGIIVYWQVCAEVAKRFGKDGGFGAGLFFLGGIFWPILGFGSAEYKGGEAKANDEVLDTE
jgi:Family of unknown function (DUF5684)